MLLHQWKGVQQENKYDGRYEEFPAPAVSKLSKGTRPHHHSQCNTRDDAQGEPSVDNKALDFLDMALLVIAEGHACSGCNEVVRCGATSAAEKEEDADSVVRQDDHEKTPTQNIAEKLEKLEQKRRDRPPEIPELVTGDSFQSIEDDDVSAVSSDTIDFMEVQNEFFCCAGGEY